MRGERMTLVDHWDVVVLRHREVHPPASTAHAAIAECQSLNQNDCWVIRQVEQTSEEVLHVLDMLEDPLVIDSKFDQYQISLGRNVQWEAEGEVVGPSSYEFSVLYV